MKFMADSCSNFNLPAVEGDVSIKTAMYRGEVCDESSEKVSICCWTLSSKTKKSSFVRPGTNCPFLSTTVIGKRTRRTGILIDWSSWPGVGLGEGFVFWANVYGGTASRQMANKELVKRRIRAARISSGL